MDLSIRQILTQNMTILMKTKLWSKEVFAEFKVDYDNALLLKQNRFIFHGNWYDIGFAKYLIEYLNDKFDNNGKDN